MFGATTLVVTGAGGVTTQIVSVGADFEYDLGASRANKHFSVGGVRIASLATSYTACGAPCAPRLPSQSANAPHSSASKKLVSATSGSVTPSRIGPHRRRKQT